MQTSPTSTAEPSRSARLARISAVAQMTGASGLTAASPVIIPTRSGPRRSHRSKNFSEHEGLDRGRVVRAPTLGEGEDHRADGHQALARPGGRGQDHVRSRGQLEQGVLLRRVQREAAAIRPRGEVLEEVLRARCAPGPVRGWRGVGREQVDQRPAGGRPRPWLGLRSVGGHAPTLPRSALIARMDGRSGQCLLAFAAAWCRASARRRTVGSSRSAGRVASQMCRGVGAGPSRRTATP